MFLASRGYWGGNPELILNAPFNLVLSAIDFAIRREKEKMDMYSAIADSIARRLR